MKVSYDLHYKATLEPTDTRLSLISTLRVVVLYNNELYFISSSEPFLNGLLQEGTPLAEMLCSFMGVGVSYHANGVLLHPSYNTIISDMNSFIKKVYSTPSTVFRAPSHKVNITHNVLLHKKEEHFL